MSLREKIITLAENNNMTVRSFEIKCDLSIGTIQKCQKSITTTALAKILRQFPDTDIFWLLDIEDVKPIAEPEKVAETGENEWLRQQIAIKDEQIRFLQRLLEKGEPNISQSINM